MHRFCLSKEIPSKRASSSSKTSRDSSPHPADGGTDDAVSLTMAVLETSPLCLKGSLRIKGPWRHTWLQRCCHLVMERDLGFGQRQASNVQAFDSLDIAVMEFCHQYEKLGLSAGICRNDLMHAFQWRHLRLCSCDFLVSVLGTWARNAPDIQMASFGGPLVELHNQWVVSVREIRRYKETGGAKEEVVPVAVKA